MDADHSNSRNPRRLALLTLLLGLAVFGLAVRAFTGAWTPAGVTHVPTGFDAVFGIFGGAALIGVASGLWRGRVQRSAAYASWAALAAVVTFRAALFARADYERGRLPFFALAALILLGGMVLSLLREYRQGREQNS